MPICPRASSRFDMPQCPLRAWNAQQLQEFLATARSHRLFPALWLAANTGMRRSELLGLRWEDVNLESSRLGVSRALVSMAYELHDSPGRTRSSRFGDVGLSRHSVRMLWIVRLGPRGSDEPSPQRGQPVSPVAGDQV